MQAKSKYGLTVIKKMRVLNGLHHIFYSIGTPLHYTVPAKKIGTLVYLYKNFTQTFNKVILNTKY